jgi:hypothetical protein
MSTHRNEHALVFNGIDARTGTYLLPPFDVGQIARLALGHRLAPDDLAELHAKMAQVLDFPLREGRDPDDLAESGWAVIFPFARKGSEAARRQVAARAALEPLLARRRAQATRRHERYYRECIGFDAYRPGESKQQFLARMGAGAGPVDPDRFPYYLLLVASPEEIPYRVQYQLDVQYAVGRIHFDTVDEYARYAEAVIEAEVAAETWPRPGARTAAFFGVENPGDRATQASARLLVEPLARFAESEQGERGWQVRRFLAGEATKARLGALLGDEPPSLLVTASHGVGFPSGDARQREHQGALLCQDWEGPRAGAVSPEHYFAGEDIAGDADLRGLISFHFACFGAGTPRHDDFVRRTLDRVEPVGIAPCSFLARLPQRLLGRPRGALACVGHVDRAWSSSFLQPDPRHASGVTAQLAVFESMLERLMDGRRVGHAMDFFDVRYAELASDLATRIEGIQLYDEPCDEDELARTWLYANDARNYAVIGDPAVRLASSAEPEPAPPRSAHAGIDIAATPAAAASAPAGSPPGSPPGSIAVAPPPPVAPADGDDGWFDREGEGERAGLSTQLAHDVTQALRRLVADGLSLEVQTFAGDPEAAQAAVAGQAQARAPSAAYTRCAIDGDMVLCVPVREDGAIDETLWRIHENAVAQAQKQRRDMIELVLSLLPGVRP